MDRYRCVTHVTKVFVKTTILFLQCYVRQQKGSKRKGDQ